MKLNFFYKGNIVLRFEKKFLSVYSFKSQEKASIITGYLNLLASFLLEKLIFIKTLSSYDYFKMCYKTGFDYSAFISVMNKNKFLR